MYPTLHPLDRHLAAASGRLEGDAHAGQQSAEESRHRIRACIRAAISNRFIENPRVTAAARLHGIAASLGNHPNPSPAQLLLGAGCWVLGAGIFNFRLQTPDSRL